ncbi:MAG: hypothetical protein [Bacteriophage sp.]|nr:MAG: hypothetical protein [Bacteriophage sp.]
MTVKELIDKLQQFNGDRVVLVEDAEYGEFQAIDVKPENFNLMVGSNYARIKAEDKIWEGLGFVLQWAKYGLKK